MSTGLLRGFLLFFGSGIVELTTSHVIHCRPIEGKRSSNTEGRLRSSSSEAGGSSSVEAAEASAGRVGQVSDTLGVSEAAF